MDIASREFQVLAKPIGAVCNLGCRYCYYLQKKDLYPHEKSFRLPDDLLERYIVQHIAACPRDLVLFSWHGGEPTVLGIDYFRRITEMQRKHLPQGKRVLNGIQTNGTLLDEEWAAFLAEERFYVGLSLDGPRELHDRYRLARGQKGTHRLVVKALRLLQRRRVSCDLLCVVHHENVRYPAPVYQFFRDLGAEYLQFLPFVARGVGSRVTRESVPAEAYGEFLCTIFHEWVRHDVGRIGIQNFDEALRPFLGLAHALCVSRETCGDVVVMEHNGDVYMCDHFVDPAHWLGNLHEQSLLAILEDPALRRFGQDKSDRLPRYCRACDVLALCNGGCPKDRIASTPDGEEGLNHLCAGLKRFYSYSAPYLESMAACRRSGQPIEGFMQALRAQDAAPARAGRNDPCPCGSGKKYKKCCLARAVQ